MEVFGIDDDQYDRKFINQNVDLNSIEDWTIVNETNTAHPYFMQGVQFYVMGVADSSGNELPIPVQNLGLLDNILVPAFQSVTIRIRFKGFGSPTPFDLDSAAYIFGSQNMRHQDGYYAGAANRGNFGLLQQFAIWNGEGFNPTSIEREIALPWTLYPNPADDQLRIDADYPKASTLNIYDIQGRLLQTNELPPLGTNNPINISTLEQGMIIVEWKTEKGSQLKKVILR